MKALSPKLSSTKVSNSPWEWIPKTIEDFLTELEFIATHCKELEHLVLYRGHRDRRWLLDSTFARSCKKNIFGIEPWQKLRFEDFRMSTKHQQIVLNLFFFKFDFVARPSPKLSSVAETTGVDPWFEFMKRLQQYPEEDPTYCKGPSSLIGLGTWMLQCTLPMNHEREKVPFGSATLLLREKPCK